MKLAEQRLIDPLQRLVARPVRQTFRCGANAFIKLCWRKITRRGNARKCISCEFGGWLAFFALKSWLGRVASRANGTFPPTRVYLLNDLQKQQPGYDSDRKSSNMARTSVLGKRKAAGKEQRLQCHHPQTFDSPLATELPPSSILTRKRRALPIAENDENADPQILPDAYESEQTSSVDELAEPYVSSKTSARINSVPAKERGVKRVALSPTKANGQKNACQSPSSCFMSLLYDCADSVLRVCQGAHHHTPK